jgi:hypothetical protein
MIPCPYCEGKLLSNGTYNLKTGEMCRRFRCQCCGRSRNAYSINGGETYKWDAPQTKRSRRTQQEYVFI